MVNPSVATGDVVIVKVKLLKIDFMVLNIFLCVGSLGGDSNDKCKVRECRLLNVTKVGITRILVNR